jgi:hypothetical protein
MTEQTIQIRRADYEDHHSRGPHFRADRLHHQTIFMSRKHNRQFLIHKKAIEIMEDPATTHFVDA